MNPPPDSPADDGVATETGYPQEWEADVVLSDGTTAHLRPIAATDRDALQRFHTGQSERSTYMRFFAAMERLSARDLTRFTVLDHRDRVAIVAVSSVPRAPGTAAPEEPGVAGTDTSETIIGVARFDTIEPGEAEVAFNIADSHQGRGLGSALLEHIAAAAREVGVQRFTAEVLPQNGKMLAVFREAGYETTQHVDDGIVTVSIDLDPTERSRQVMIDREHRAEARSMVGLFSPRSVVVVPPSDDDTSSLQSRMAARAIGAHLRDGDVTMTVVGASPALRAEVGDPTGLRFVEVLEDVETPVDLALVMVRPADALATVRRLAGLGVRGVVVSGPGYAETGPEGLALQREVVRTAHAAGMRVVGPGSYGMFARRPEGAFNVSLAPVLPPAGRVGIFCQSAPMAVTVLATVWRRGVGVSSFVSAGNRADVSGNDLMQFWQDDESTDVAGLYLESIGNPRKFSRIARRLSLVKPVVVVTAGRSGHVVPAGHAVRPTRAPRRTLEEMLRQSGVIRAENTHQMLDIIQLLSSQPLPSGRRVGIVAGSAPLSAIVAEAAGAAGLTVTGHVGVVREDASEAENLAAIAAVYAEGACDVVVAVHVPVLGGTDVRFCTAVAAAAARSGRPTVASVLGLHGLLPELTAEVAGETDPAADEIAGAGAGGTVLPGDQQASTTSRSVTVPAYSTPEDAVQALGAVVRYATWRHQDHGQPLTYTDVDVAGARAVIERRTEEGRRVDLPADEVRALLARYGIEVWESVPVRDADEAVAAAEQLGWPVALKSTAESLRHRADLGGVRLDILDEAELRTDVAQMQSSLVDHVPELRRPAARPLEVQRMAPAGVACVIRSTEDQLYGPVVSFGLSGDAVDLLGDVSYGVPPLTTGDVAHMVRSVRAAPRLFGYKGLPPADAAAIEDLIGRVSELADDHPEIRSLELYPVVVAERGAAVLSARVTLSEANRKDGLRRALPD